MTQDNTTTRRDFLQAGAALGGAALLAGGVHADGGDQIRVGIVGCGGRGSGAAEDVLRSAKNVRIVAIGDAFEGQAKAAAKRMAGFAKGAEVTGKGNSVDLADRVYHGLDAYQKVIASDCNYVILATPPGFRPMHIEAAINAGKHLFTEKPVGVDGPGIRKVLASYEKAKEKKLCVVAGTQRRHQAGYIETIKRIHGGEIGEIVGGQCYWMQGILWARPRKKDQTDLQYQINNWYNFVWLCGDHIVEQHVHNIDVLNWALQSHPEKAVSMGFRTRTNKDYGHIYDFFATDYYWPKGVQTLSMCRQISECANNNSERVVGTKGVAQVDAHRVNGKPVAPKKGAANPYVQEHTDLINAIRGGTYLNELKTVAESTLTAIMGRMSAYTGKAVTWEDALNSEVSLMPENLAWDMQLPDPPVAVPGPKARA